MRSIVIWTAALLGSALLGLAGFQLLAQPPEPEPAVAGSVGTGPSGTAVPQPGATPGSAGPARNESDDDEYGDDGSGDRDDAEVAGNYGDDGYEEDDD